MKFQILQKSEIVCTIDQDMDPPNPRMATDGPNNQNKTATARTK